MQREEGRKTLVEGRRGAGAAEPSRRRGAVDEDRGGEKDRRRNKQELAPRHGQKQQALALPKETPTQLQLSSWGKPEPSDSAKAFFSGQEAAGSWAVTGDEVSGNLRRGWASSFGSRLWHLGKPTYAWENQHMPPQWLTLDPRPASTENPGTSRRLHQHHARKPSALTPYT